MGVELIALIILCIVCFAIVIGVGVYCVKKERNSNFKSKDKTMFYPNDAMYGKDWQKKLKPEQMKKITAAYTASVAEYNKGAE